MIGSKNHAANGRLWQLAPERLRTASVRIPPDAPTPGPKRGIL